MPGAFELPIVAKKMAESGKYDAVICLGAVIRGSTTHYDYVCNEASKGIAQVGMQTGVPTIFSVVTTENIEQAIERAGTKAGNKGRRQCHVHHGDGQPAQETRLTGCPKKKTIRRPLTKLAIGQPGQRSCCTSIPRYEREQERGILMKIGIISDTHGHEMA